MSRDIIEIADGFWNIRGSFKVGGLIDVGTHVSLVRRQNGGFVFLDSYTFDETVQRRVDEITRGGAGLEAILNVHPFHTVHVRRMHERFPNAKLFGTARHVEKLPDLPWQPLHTEDQDLHAMFADDFDFTVPSGVDFISANENVHFSSVLALHRRSKTIHVDDTLIYVRLPKLARAFGRSDLLSFHPTLGQALERRPGAARDFRRWAQTIVRDWRDAENLCAAHSANLLASKNAGASIADRISRALEKAERTLASHERKYG